MEGREAQTRLDVQHALAAVGVERVPGIRACLDLARAYERAGEADRAVQWALAATDAGDELAGWSVAARIVATAGPARTSRTARVAVLGSYTTSQLTALLPVAAARAGVAVEVYEAGFGQYRLELLDPDSGLHAFAPDVIVLAVHDAEVALPALAADPDAAVAEELARWTSLWDQAGALGARVIQHTFAPPPEVALGHLALRTPGSRHVLLRRLNEALGLAAVERGGTVSLVDCERLAAQVGAAAWFDARYYHLAKQAVGLRAVPLLARHTAAVLGAMLGTSRKVLVLDLDDTLWGAVLGEVGPDGITLGTGPAGEAFSAFQRYVLDLKAKGVVLAVCSKNDEDAVRDVLARHPDMLVRADDIAVLVAGWDDKPTGLRRIAATLDVGLDALVFVDDNPAEREAVRQLLPEVDVVALPRDPSRYVAALAAYPFFETASLTVEDAARTDAYRARAQAAAARDQAGTIEEFLAGLQMEARFLPLDAASIERVTQLIGKTNQFTVTSRRHDRAWIEAFSRDEAGIAVVARLKDRFADHGIVGVLLAVAREGVADIDTWLLSCRVIGRRLEEALLEELARQAHQRGLRAIRGTYVPSPKNSQVSTLYSRLGFSPVHPDALGNRGDDGAREDDATSWEVATSQVLAAAPGRLPIAVQRVPTPATTRR